MSDQLPHSELILNDDGSIYHLHLKEEHVADTVILVGDQGRVERISQFFDSVECRIKNREFVTHTGLYKGKRLSVISSGIGTDNIDIVVNELDAAVNMDLESRSFKSKRKALNLIRLGTTGAIQDDIPVGSFVISQYGLGLDGLMHHYNYSIEEEDLLLQEEIIKHLNLNQKHPEPYLAKADTDLFESLREGMIPGITATASGFYAPQGRSLYLAAKNYEIEFILQTFEYEEHRITNFEMETSALYGLAHLLGHRACTCCVVLANRNTGTYAANHHEVVESLILTLLEKIARLSSAQDR